MKTHTVHMPVSYGGKLAKTYCGRDHNPINREFYDWYNQHYFNELDSVEEIASSADRRRAHAEATGQSDARLCRACVRSWRSKP